MVFLFTATAQMVSAHDAGTFTILVKESGPTPNNPQLFYNDSVWWYNVDSTENVTHRIVWDSDGDGLYNGTTDWDSGNLSSECEKDENGTKLDEDCEMTYEIPFNGTWGAGVYEYSVIRSDGVVNNGTISVFDDTHAEDGSSPPAEGYEFGNEDSGQDSEAEGGAGERNWLLYIAGGSGALSLLLLGLLIVMGPGKDVLTPADGEPDEEMGFSDSDIEEIAEEE